MFPTDESQTNQTSNDAVSTSKRAKNSKRVRAAFNDHNIKIFHGQNRSIDTTNNVATSYGGGARSQTPISGVSKLPGIS